MGSGQTVTIDAVSHEGILEDQGRDPLEYFGGHGVEGAEVGDVLKIETLEATPRVPYGVVSSRHGRGALALTAEGGAPDGIALDQVMPPLDTDGRDDAGPTAWGTSRSSPRSRTATASWPSAAARPGSRCGRSWG